MLLIKQTFEHAPSERVVSLNGPLVQLGLFSDVLNDTASSEGRSDIFIGWELSNIEDHYYSNLAYSSENRPTLICAGFSFDISGPAEERGTRELQPDLKTAHLQSRYVDSSSNEHELKIDIERSTGRGRRLHYDSSVLGESSQLRFRVADVDSETKDVSSALGVSASIVGSTISHFMPSGLIVRYDRHLQTSKRIVSSWLEQHNPRRFRLASIEIPQDVRSILSDCLKRATENTRHNDSAIAIIEKIRAEDVRSDEITELLRAMPLSARRQIRDTLACEEAKLVKLMHNHLGIDKTIGPLRVDQISRTSTTLDRSFRFFLRYLGPLRADPKPLYPLQALSSPTDVGPKGELTAAVLHLNGKRKITFLAPSAFADSPVGVAAVQETLIDATAAWLDYLGVAEEISVNERGKFGHELRVRPSKQSSLQDLTNVGVGVSQILPIVVTCLLAPTGSSIILEQPELHLHPAVQSRLADFFVAMTLLGKQCIIETHSEHLIERIRFRVVQDQSNRIHENTKIYFFTKEAGATSVRDVAVSKYGSIDDWPKDFFDQSQIANEEIILMALRRHKSEMRDGSA